MRTRLEVALLLALIGCKEPSRAGPAPCTSAAPAAFDPGPPPNAAFFVVAEGGGHGAFTSTATATLLRYDNALYELRGDALVRRVDLEHEDAGREKGIVASARWKHGSTLTLARPQRRLDAPFVFTVHGSADAPPATGGQPDIEYEDMGALDDGEVFAVGDHRVERWPADGGASVVETLPSRKDRSQPEVKLVYARSPTEVWVAGWDFHGNSRLPYLARFDGHAWSAQDAPGSGYVGAITGGPDGSLWYAADALQWLEPGVSWSGSSLPLPTDVLASTRPWVERDGLCVVGRRDVWLLIRYGDRSIVVHTRPGAGVLDLDDGTALTFAQAKKRWTLPPAWEGWR